MLDKEKLLKDYYYYKIENKKTQREVAIEAGMNPGTLTKILNGVSVKQEVYYRLEKFLKDKGGN